MTVCEFNALDGAAKETAIYNAVHVGHRWDRQHNIILYQRDNFYIEVFYHRELNMITQILTFEDIDRLGPYLPAINIERC